MVIVRQRDMKATWLIVLLPVIGAFHAIGFFWMYGHLSKGGVLLIMFWLAALLLYISALYPSTLFKKNGLRGVKVTFLSLLLSLISSYVGVLLAFDTYGT